MSVDAPSNAELLADLRPDPDSALPKVRQLYLSLYGAIEAGRLPFETRLPASRILAERLGLGRNTVTTVYEQLVAEGLLHADGRRGTRVARRVGRSPDEVETDWFRAARATDFASTTIRHRALASGEPDTELFPQSVWRRALVRASQRVGDRLGYQPSSLPSAQVAIARFLATYRSLHVQPQQIIVTASTRQSLSLAAHLFADPGDACWLECPGYPGAVDACRQAGLIALPADIDEQGFVPRVLSDTPPRLIYLTPCFQFPQGMPLSAARREQLLHLSRAHGVVIFEDDYDSEFRDDTQPRPALASEANGARVLHAGTFSKLLFPAVRVAWLVVPLAHVEDAHRALRAAGGGNTQLLQATIAELLDNGEVSRHLRRARQVYGQRRRALIDAIHGSALLQPTSHYSGGLNLVLQLDRAVPLETLRKTLYDARLGVQPLETLDWSRREIRRCNAVVVGLGNVQTLAIAETVQRLEEAVALAQA